MTIGQRMKARRKELKMSADELAKRLNKDRSTIYRYEKGDIENLPLDLLEPIAFALDTSPQYLMGWDYEPEETIKNSEAIADLTSRMLSDYNFFSVVKKLSKLDESRLQDANDMLDLLFKQSLNQNED